MFFLNFALEGGGCNPTVPLPPSGAPMAADAHTHIHTHTHILVVQENRNNTLIYSVYFSNTALPYTSKLSANINKFT